MAGNAFNRSVLALLWQSRLKETRKHTQNRERCAQRRYLRCRRLVSSLFFLFLTRYLFTHLPVCRVWTKPRSQLFWEETCQGWNERDWVENFRMSKETFNCLCLELSPHILKRDTNFRKAIAECHWVAITLYWLADTAHYRMIANLFGVGETSVCGIVKQLCEVIVRILPPRFILFPKIDRKSKIRLMVLKVARDFPR